MLKECDDGQAIEWNGPVSTDREHLEGFKKVVYTRQKICEMLQRVEKRSLCRLGKCAG